MPSGFLLAFCAVTFLCPVSLYAQGGHGTPKSACSSDRANLANLEKDLQGDINFLNDCAKHPLSAECKQEGPGMNQAVQNLNLEISSLRLQMETDCGPLPPIPPNVFEIDTPPGVFPLPPCTPVNPPGFVHVAWRQETGASVTLSLRVFDPSTQQTADLPPGIQATFSPSQGYGDFDSALTIYQASGSSGPPITVVVQGTTMQIVQGKNRELVALSQPFTIQAAPPSIGSITPTGKTPQYLGPGTEVVIQGSGFCPGMQVQFGNPLAVVPPYFQTPTELHAPVANLATNGPIALQLNGALSAVSSNNFAADSFRNTSAFSFPNYVPHTTFDQLTGAFGPDQTYDSIELCWPFDCTVSVRDPWAMILNAIANGIFDKPGTGGACFGFALGSQRISQGQVNLANFQASWPVFPPGAGTNFSLDSPVTETDGTCCGNVCQNGAGPSGPMIEFINSQNVSQLSEEMLAEFLAATRHSSQDVYGAIRSNLSAGRAPVISLIDGSGGFPPEGHSVVAYNLEGAGPPNAFDIDVYDPNVQFVRCENDDGGGTTHQGRVQNSQIHVAADGSWKLPSTNDSSGNAFNGGIGGLIVTSPGTYPMPPTMIGVGAIGELLLFGLGGAAANSPTVGSRTTQVTDAAGHTLLDASGNLNTNPTTRLTGTPFAPLVGRKAPVEAFIVTSKAGRLEQTVVGTAVTPDQHVLVAPGFIAQLSTQAIPDVSDRIGFDPAGAVSFETTADSKPVVVGLIKHDEGIARSAEITIRVSKNANEELRFDPNSSALVFHHSGPGSNYRLRLSALGKSAHGQSFDSGRLLIASNVTVTFGLSDWSKMDTIPMTVRDAQGQETRQSVSNHAKLSALGRITGLRVIRPHGSGTARAVELVSQLKRLPQNSEVAFAWSVQREGLTIAHGSRTLGETQLSAGPRHDHFEFDAKINGRYAVRVDLIILTTQGVIRTSQTMSRIVHD
jgi:hypothetical protein